MADPATLTKLAAGAILAAPGVWLLAKGLPRLIRPNPELRWQPVEGEILESFVDEKDTGDGTEYSTQVEYSYEWKGIRFIGNRIAPLTPLTPTHTSAQLKWFQYSRGRKVTVYVNPANPGDAVLEPGRQTLTALGTVALGLLFCGCGYFLTTIGRSPD